MLRPATFSLVLVAACASGSKPAARRDEPVLLIEVDRSRPRAEPEPGTAPQARAPETATPPGVAGTAAASVAGGWEGPTDGCFWHWAGTILHARCATPGVWGDGERDEQAPRVELSECDASDFPHGNVFPSHCSRLEADMDFAHTEDEELRLGFQAGSPMHMLGARIVVLVVRATPGGTPSFRWVGRGYRHGPREEHGLPTPPPPERP